MPYRSLTKRVGNAVRLAEVIQVLMRHGFADLLRRIGLYEGLPAKALRGMHLMKAPESEPRNLAGRLRAALTELGPTFVKAGQIMSTRPDIVGLEIARGLEQLQDRVSPVPFGKMKPIIETGLGGSVHDLYRTFEPEPVASASLSQVYRAVLRDGTQVAVKVQRPGVRDVIEADLHILHGFAEWAQEHINEVGWVDPVGVVEEFRRSIRRELDFTIETHTLERFRSNFEGMSHVFVPAVYRALCSDTVITMDWIDGVRLDAIEHYEERGCDPATVAVTGCEILCKQVFEDRFFHADPHPGNILVTRNNQVAFLDYGMVGHLEDSDVLAMADLLRAVLHEDPAGCVQNLLSFTVSGEVRDLSALEHEIAEFIAFEARAIMGGGQVGKATDRVVRILRHHNLQLSPRFSLLLKALATIESSGHLLDPDLDMVPVVRPYIERIITRRFTPSHLLRESRHDLVGLLQLTRELPGDVRQLARMLRRGQIKIQLHHEKLDNVSAVADRASNRVTFGVITGAIIVGSSLLIASDTGAKTLGLVGYIIAGLLGLAILISILRSKNF